ncbi:preprotein translocase subunit SecG [Patescibacteria group bacterium]|nr:preprotein translocase subunit SecG [Patescibacteria group bacterium]
MNILQVFQIIIAVLLVASILLQNRGSSVGGIFGGGGEVFSVKRGAEKALFKATIILSVLFVGIALLGIKI